MRILFMLALHANKKTVECWNLFGEYSVTSDSGSNFGTANLVNIHTMFTYLCVLICLLAATGVSSQEDSTVRLVNGTNNYSGRVEVFLNGQWGTVCDDRWNIKDGHVVCRQLGYSGVASVLRHAFYGQGEGPIQIDDVRCTGSESRLVDCRHTDSSSHDCGHDEDAGVVCNRRPADCGFSSDEVNRNVTFEATRAGTCSLVINSSIDELIVVTIKSFALHYANGRCINYLQEYGDNHEIDAYCGYGDSSETYFVFANRYELRITTGNIRRPSSFDAHLQIIDSITSCNFEDVGGCGISNDETSWTHGTTITFCDLYGWIGSGTSLQTDSADANFELNIMPSREIVLFFRYTFTDCNWLSDGTSLKVDFCGVSHRVGMAGYLFRYFACDDENDKIIFTAETTQGYFVYVDDIVVWDLDNTGITDVQDFTFPPFVIGTSFPASTEENIVTGGSFTEEKDIVTASTQSSPPFPSGGRTAYYPDSMKGEVPSPPSPVVYTISAVLVILIILVAIVGFIIIQRNRKGGTNNAGTSVSYNNRTYEAGSPIQLAVPGYQEENGNYHPPANQEEIYNPAYPSSGDDKEEMYNSAYESSDGLQRHDDVSGKRST